MHQMIKKTWILAACFFFLGALNELSAQTKKCFEDVRQDGLLEFKKRNFNKAIDSYIAALNCPDKPLENDLYDLIKQAQKAIDTDLLVKSEAAKKAVAEATEAGEEVKKAQDLADKAKKAEMQEDTLRFQVGVVFCTSTCANVPCKWEVLPRQQVPKRAFSNRDNRLEISQWHQFWIEQYHCVQNNDRIEISSSAK